MLLHTGASWLDPESAILLIWIVQASSPAHARAHRQVRASRRKAAGSGQRPPPATPRA
jgi:hypothetical protein